MNEVLRLHEVSMTYGSGPTEVHALRDVSLSVGTREMVAVMGPSGSGKSSLLTIAGSLEQPTSGRVVVDGRDLADLGHDERAALRRTTIGYVFQEFNLLSGLTAVENVAMPLELDGVRAGLARRRAAEVLRTVGLQERADHYPDDLSGGERQRVAIARAVVGQRRLLLADEPSGALDTVNGEAVMRLLLDMAASGVAVMLVTHDPRLAAWADRVVFLHDGRLHDRAAAPTGVEALLDEGPS